jgi:hypothetical protein
MSGPFANQPSSAWPAATPPTPKRVRAKLNTVVDVRKQMATIFRECRSGVLDVSDGSRLVNMLSLIGRTISESDLEKRLAKLEGLEE